MIVTIILTASYIGDDVASYMHWLYAMRYFSVTDGRTDEQGDSRSRMNLRIKGEKLANGKLLHLESKE